MLKLKNHDSDGWRRRIPKIVYHMQHVHIYCFENSEVQYCQVLSDDKKRALYDQYGEAGVKSTVGGGAGYTVLPNFSSIRLFCFLLVLFFVCVGLRAYVCVSWAGYDKM